MAEIFGNSTPEEEMVSWLHYHLEEDDRDYCCGIFGDKAESILDFARVEDEREKEIAANRAEEALALGAGRAAGILPQTGGEVFQEVKTSQNAAAAKHGLPPRPRPVSSTVPSQLQAQQQQPLSKVFQSFYQPVAFPKANIHSSPGSKYPELPVRDVMSTISTTSTASAITVMESSASESSSTVIYVSEAGNKKCVPSQCTNAQKAAEKALERNESWSCSNASDHSACKSVNPELDSPRGNECSNLLNVNRKVDVQIPCKPSVTSSSGGSLSSPAKEAETGKKRKQADMDEMECESEEAQEFSGDTSKQPSTQTHFIKRSRAAQVHNLSEKRRRSRINEKMKALQDLIPNSNKTDKASMLDEAIEYLKQLQLQVQLLSMRNGMTVSPMYVPVVPYMQMPQMCIGVSMGHAGMHMGMGMGMGMGLMDMSQGGSGQPMLDLANPVPGQLHPMVMPNMSTTATDAHGSVQTSCETDSSQVDLPYPQLPAASQDIYSPYLLPQQPTHLNHSGNNPTGGSS